MFDIKSSRFSTNLCSQEGGSVACENLDRKIGTSSVFSTVLRLLPSLFEIVIQATSPYSNKHIFHTETFGEAGKREWFKEINTYWWVDIIIAYRISHSLFNYPQDKCSKYRLVLIFGVKTRSFVINLSTGSQKIDFFSWYCRATAYITSFR